MTPAEQLRAAKALIDAPEKWTREAFARNAQGVPTILRKATCFCALGALDFAGHVALAYDESAEDLLKDAVPTRFMNSITAFNDHPDTTHADVMALFDRAIALAEQPA